MAKIPFTEALRFDPATTLFVSDLDGTLLTPDASSGSQRLISSRITLPS